jgi:hypothetical protein
MGLLGELFESAMKFAGIIGILALVVGVLTGVSHSYPDSSRYMLAQLRQL